MRATGGGGERHAVGGRGGSHALDSPTPPPPRSSFPHLESSLDWLLAIYKFAFPFLVISMVAKLSSRESDDSSPPQQPAARRRVDTASGGSGGAGGGWQGLPPALGGATLPRQLTRGSSERHSSLSPRAPPTPVEGQRQQQQPLLHPAASGFYRTTSLAGSEGGPAAFGFRCVGPLAVRKMSLRLAAAGLLLGQPTRGCAVPEPPCYWRRGSSAPARFLPYSGPMPPAGTKHRRAAAEIQATTRAF